MMGTAQTVSLLCLADLERRGEQPLEQRGQGEEEERHDLGCKPAQEDRGVRLSHGDPDGDRDAHEPEHEVGDGDPEEHFEPPQEPDSSERERLAQVDDADEVEHDLDGYDHRHEADKHGNVDGQPSSLVRRVAPARRVASAWTAH